MIVNANQAAHKLLDESGCGLVGKEAIKTLPDVINTVLVSNIGKSGGCVMLEYKEKTLAVNIRRLGAEENYRGIVLACMIIEKE
jgi:hypothetical protein